MRSANHGVYIAAHEFGRGETGALIPGNEHASPGVHVFVCRQEDSGPTGFRSDKAAGQILMDLMRGKSWGYDFDAGQFHPNTKFGTSVFDAVPKLTIHEPDQEFLDESAQIELFRKALKNVALRKRFGKEAKAPDPPKLIEMGLGQLKPMPPALVSYLRQHCRFLLVGGTSEWGSYFYAVNGTIDAKPLLAAAFRAAGIPVYDVPTERDLPVW